MTAARHSLLYAIIMHALQSKYTYIIIIIILNNKICEYVDRYATCETPDYLSYSELI